MLNSGTSVGFFNQIQKASEKNKFNFKDDCGLRASYYRNASGCFECDTKVLSTSSTTCINYCPVNFKNPLTGNCINCLNDFCTEIGKTKWEVEKLDPGQYRLKPSRPVLNDNLNLDNLVKVKFDGETSSAEKYDYEFTKTVNKAEQHIDLDFDFKERIIDKKLNFEIQEDPENPQYDINRNLLFQDTLNLTSSVNVNTITDNICYISSTKKDALKGLAIATLIIFLIGVVFLIIFSILCAKKTNMLGGLWKFLLHHWMKLQLIAFLIFLGIYMPCCIKEYLKWLYKIAVGWDHAFRTIIDDINEDDSDYVKGMIEERVPQQFYERFARAFILHNIAVAFIVQLVIFFIWLILKIWDCMISNSGSCMYATYVWIDYTGLIVGYLLVHMHAFVFSALNFRKANFSHAYFTICFLIAIAYILVFTLFWFYSLYRLIGSSLYFVEPINQNKFYYFFAGYRDSKWARTWDHWMTLVHLIVGFMIALAYDKPLSQTIVILVALVILLALTFVLRPWRMTIFFIAEIIIQVLIIFVVVIFLIIAAYDDTDCYSCGDREGVLCWLVVIALFLAVLLGVIALIAQALKSAFFPTSYTKVTDDRDMEMEQNYYSNVQDKEMLNSNTEYKNQAYNSNFQRNNVFNEEINTTTKVVDTKAVTMQDFMN